MTRLQATAIAHSNIAFVKYWGNRDPLLRLPYNDSLSMNLSAATTTTTVSFSEALNTDRLTIDGEKHIGPALDRVSRQLDLVRLRAGLRLRAAVQSRNSFPMGTGIASSASGFAALTMAAAQAAGLGLSQPELSALARRGSGSAARSIPGGYVLWHAGSGDRDSFAESVFPADHWDLRDIVAIVSRRHKGLGSTDGHSAAEGSPLFQGRLASVPETLALVQGALASRDIARFGAAVEAEALNLHAIAMTGRPPALYWNPATVAVMLQVQTWRAEGLAVWFTLDAGPNVHLLCEGKDATAVEGALRNLEFVEAVLANRVAGAAHLAPTLVA